MVAVGFKRYRTNVCICHLIFFGKANRTMYENRQFVYWKPVFSLNISINIFNSLTRFRGNILFLIHTCVAANSVSACLVTVVGYQTFINVFTMEDIHDSEAWSTRTDVRPHSVCTYLLTHVDTLVTFVCVNTGVMISL